LEGLLPGLQGNFDHFQKHLLVFTLSINKALLALNNRLGVLLIPVLALKNFKTFLHKFISYGYEVLESVLENNLTKFTEGALGQAPVNLFFNCACLVN